MVEISAEEQNKVKRMKRTEDNLRGLWDNTKRNNIQIIGVPEEKKRQRNATQMKEQTKNIDIQINEEEIGKLPEKEFRIMIVKMIKTLENKMEKNKNQLTKT